MVVLVMVALSLSIGEYYVFYNLSIPIIEQSQKVIFSPDVDKPNYLTAQVFFTEPFNADKEDFDMEEGQLV